MKRIFLYDNIKGLLILLVALGHVLNICGSYYNYSFGWYKLFTFFMMPLFLFIMGKFSSQSKKEPKARSKKMFIIFLIMQIITTIYYGFVLKIISFDKSFLIPRFTLWYLLTCSYYYLSDYLLRKIKFKHIFIISIIFAIFGGFIPIFTNILSISRTINFFPFYVLGFYESEINLESKIKSYKKIFIGLGIIITIFFLFNQNFFLSKDTYLKYTYYSYATPLVCFYKRLILYILFFVYSAFVYCIIPNRKTIFSKIGNKTMYIYLSHGIILKSIEKYKFFLTNPILGTIGIYIFVLLSGIYIYWIINYFKKKGMMVIEGKNKIGKTVT